MFEEKGGNLVVISPPHHIREEHEMVIQMIDAGLRYYHVRKTAYTQDQTARYLMEYPDRYRRLMILHEHYQLAVRYGLAGIHITKKNKNKGYEDHFSHLHVSISTHSCEEIWNLQRPYHYAFLSPVFDSLSKKKYASAFDKEELHDFFSTYSQKIPVMALGGIHPGNIMKLKNIGFSGYAVLGAIWGNFPEQLIPGLSLEVFRKLNRMVSKP